MDFRRWDVRIALLCAAAALCLAAPMPKGYFHGAMAGWEGTVDDGRLTARDASGDLYDCGFDDKSFLEFEHRRILVDELEEGDPLEILVDDRRPGKRGCYVRILHVVGPEPLSFLLDRPTGVSRTTFTRRPARRGRETLSGIVGRIEGRRVTLRTRSGDEVVQLRRDTEFLANGVSLTAEDLAVNRFVSVQAGRNRDGELEAYRVSWGEILTVR